VAIVVCNECDKFVDDDYFPCETDPRDSCALLCPCCSEQFYDENGELIIPVDPKKDDGDYAYDNWKDKQLEDK